MLDIFTHENIEGIRAFLTDIVLPICTVLIPCIIGFYFKMRKELTKSMSKFIISFERKLKDWEKEHSRLMNGAITLYMDKEHDNPYNRIDQIVFLVLENGLSTSNNIHNMFWSVSSEDTSMGRILKKTDIQRVPYTALIPVKEIMEKNYVKSLNAKEHVMAVKNTAEYPAFAQQPVFEGVSSFLAVPVMTPDNYLLGILFLNYADPDFNDSNLDNEIESLLKIKHFIEGEVLSYNKHREEFIKTAKNM